MTRNLQAFTFLANYSFCYLNLTGIAKFKYKRKNEINSKKMSSCKRPIELFHSLGHHQDSVMPGNLGNDLVGSEILAGRKWDSEIFFRNFTYIQLWDQLSYSLTSNSWNYSCPRSVYSILAPCVALWTIPIHKEDFTHIPYNRWDKYRKRKVPCTVSGRFTQLWSKHSQFRE